MSGQKSKVHLGPNVSSSAPLPWVRSQWQWSYGSNMSIIIIIIIMYNYYYTTMIETTNCKACAIKLSIIELPRCNAGYFLVMFALCIITKINYYKN